MLFSREEIKVKKISYFSIANHILLVCLSIFALIPFLLVLAGSFTNEKELIIGGVRLLPKAFSIDGYRYILRQNSSLASSYMVTIFITIMGSTISLLVTAALAYVISIDQVRLRNHISLYVYFTILFSGGLIPWYILCVRYLHLKNNILVLILPMLINPFYLFLMKTYFRGVPSSLRESGIVDGAGELRILFRIMLPVSAPMLATVALFYMLAYWNDFYLALLFVDKKELVPLQYHLYRILSNLNFLASETKVNGSGGNTGKVLLPSESVRLATTIVTIGPIVFVYPFIQKYFIKGITIGAIKG